MDKTKTPKKKNTFFEDYDLYSDADPTSTIRIKYTTEKDVINTINKLERLYKSGKITHSRNSQIANVMTQRLRVIDPKDKRLKISKQFFEFLKSRTKIKDDKDRKKLKFKL
tara:strand:- start:1961 stop:2293 length:333 start_codon:yes stop_codon:yes gene_type:complete